VRHRALDPSQKTTELRPVGADDGWVDEPLFPDQSSRSGERPETPPTILAGVDTDDDNAEFEISDYLAERGICVCIAMWQSRY